MTTSGAKRGLKARVFSIELGSGSALKKVSVPSGKQRILLEGTIGLLEHARFVEDAILELIGTDGVLRVDLSKEDLIFGKRELAKGTLPRANNGQFVSMLIIPDELV